MHDILTLNDHDPFVFENAPSFFYTRLIMFSKFIGIKLTISPYFLFMGVIGIILVVILAQIPGVKNFFDLELAKAIE